MDADDLALPPDHLALLIIRAVAHEDDTEFNRLWNGCSPRAKRDVTTCLAGFLLLAWDGIGLDQIEARLIAGQN
jgi:hypothetical protein